MEFNEFKNEVCGRDEKNNPKATIGLIYCIPIESDDASGEYELSIEDMMTFTKPSVELIYTTDPYRTVEFIRLDMEFISSYDPDINEVYSFLKKYEKNASDYYDDYTKCPALSVDVVPNNIVEKGIHYLELNMPMMISLISNKPNNMPNIISMLFAVDNCSIHEEEMVDLDEVKKEATIELMEEERQMRNRMEEEELKALKQQEMEELQKQINNLDMNERTRRVGRGSGYEEDND